MPHVRHCDQCFAQYSQYSPQLCGMGLLLPFFHLFIWMPQVLVVAHRIFCCGMWDLVPWLRGTNSIFSADDNNNNNSRGVTSFSRAHNQEHWSPGSTLRSLNSKLIYTTVSVCLRLSDLASHYCLCQFCTKVPTYFHNVNFTLCLLGHPMPFAKSLLGSCF